MAKKRKLITLAQAAAELGVDHSTVCRWCRDGAPHKRVPLVTGGAIAMVHVEDIEQWRRRRAHGNTHKIKTEVTDEQ